MKKLLLIGLIIGISFGAVAQPKSKPVVFHPKKDVSVKKPMPRAIDEPVNMLRLKSNKYVKSSFAINEEQVGVSRYDLQSNSSMQNRIYLHEDRTIGAVWTFGMDDVNGFPERGTGYNYYNGSNWDAYPTARIEDIKVGWPSYMPCEASGEMVITHTGTNAGLKIAKRTTKGTGTWALSTMAGPTGSSGLLWPRAVAGGATNQNIHVASLTTPVANSGTLYNGQDGSLMYSRSTDGGATWDILNQQFPMTDTNYYVGFGGDCYAWAQPKGNTLAFVYGNDWEDVFLMKSTDNGQTWNKTVIFQHPYPKFKENTTLVLDTPWVCDGTTACAIDNSGNVHVFFGLMRVLNDDLTDEATSYFPYSDGIAYWKEGMPMFATVNSDTLYNQGHLVGWVQDVNGNDTIFDFVDLAVYYLSVTSMPTVTIDEDNLIHLFFTSVMDNKDNGSQNYRHIWYRKSTDVGLTWTDFQDVTGGLTHNFHECVFPSLSFTADDYLHLLYQQDDEPGLAVRGDSDPYQDNAIVYLKMNRTNVGLDEFNNLVFVNQNYPNPFTTNTQIVVSLRNACKISMEITNFIGQKVYEVPAESVNSGYHTFSFDRNNFEAGIYFYTVKAGNQTITKKMIIE